MSNAITLDIDELKKFASAHPEDTYQRRQTNKILDGEQRKINAMRCRANGSSSVESMYLLDPSASMPTDVEEGSCNEYRINPNIGDPFTSSEQRYTFEPGSESIVRRKRDLAERRKIRIYPHMFNGEDVLLRDRERQQRQQQQQPFGCGSVNYPIPMYFQLRSLQQPMIPDALDYELRTRCSNSDVPQFNGATTTRQLAIQQQQQQQPQRQQIGCPVTPPVQWAITQQMLERDHNALITNRVTLPGATTGRDYTCQQLRRKRLQEQAIEGQTSCGTHQQRQQHQRRIEPLSLDTEKFVFDGKNINLTPMPTPKYPMDEDIPSGFFELGPAIPPPNPLLLSDIPASLLMYEQAIGGVKNDARLAADKPTQANRGAAIETFQTTDVASNLFGTKTKSRFEQQPQIDTTTNDDSPAKRIITLTIEQQRDALTQISDLRHSIAGLKQHIIEDRALSDFFGTAGATENMDKALQAIAKLRDTIHAIQQRRNRALESLQRDGTLTPQYQTEVANRIRLMETEVKQYHEQPNDDEITAYALPHFRGDGYTMKVGYYDAPTFANRFRSVKIGKNVRVVLYERAKRQGKTVTFIGPRRVTQFPVMWDATSRAIEVLPRMGPVVECYDAPFLQGGQFKLPEGTFDYPDVGGIKSNRLASMDIPAELEVTLYSRPKFQGERVKFIGPQKLTFLPIDWNGKVAGISIARKK